MTLLRSEGREDRRTQRPPAHDATVGFDEHPGPDGAKPRLVVVLGMHRSGTSALTRGLQTMGVQLGDRLMPGIAGVNPKGFWEDLDIYALNIEMLTAIGRGWNALSPVEDADLDVLRVGGFLTRAVELLRAKIGEASAFAFKDPRVAKLLTFWTEAFAIGGFDVSYVLTARNPLSVAGSLAKRDGLEREQSHYMWIEHVVNSLEQTKGARRVLVDYDRLLEDPERELRRVARTLDLAVDSALLEEYLREFLETSLRNSKFSPGDLISDPSCPPLLREVYDYIGKLASDAVPLDGPDTALRVEAWCNELARTKSALILADKGMARAAASRDEIAALDQRLVDLRTDLSRVEVTRDALTQQVAHQQEAIEAAEKLAAQRLAQLTDLLREGGAAGAAEKTLLLAALADAQQNISELQTGLEASVARALDLERRVSIAGDRIGLVDRQLSTAMIAMRQQEAQIAAAADHARELEGQVRASRQVLGALEGETKDLRRQADILTRTVVSRDEAIDRLGRTIAVRDAELARLGNMSEARGDQVNRLTRELSDSRGRAEALSELVALYERQAAARDAFARRIRAPLRVARRAWQHVAHPIRSFALDRDVQVIRESGWFDVDFYLDQYRDIRVSTFDPVRHYCEFGWKEGRNPTADFDTRFYLRWNLDVALARTNPFVHFIRFGRAEGRPGAAGKPPARFRWAQVQATPPKGWLQILARQQVHCGPFSRAAMALLVIPASFFHYPGLIAWTGALGRRRGFVTGILDKPRQSRSRLANAPASLRGLVSIPLAFALRIRRDGGLLPAAYGVFHFLRREGVRAAQLRLRDDVTPAAVEPAAAPTHAPLSASTARRILVMDYRVPMPDISAGERATVGILGDLCRFGFEVVFLPNGMEPAPEYEVALRGLGVTTVTRADGYASSAQYVAEMGRSFGAFYLIRVDVAESVLDIIRTVAPQARVLFHAPDVYFLREGREAELKNDAVLRAKAERIRDRELAMMRRVDHTVIVSPAELPVLREYLLDAPISVFPVLYTPIEADPPPQRGRRDVFFLGGFAHSPNVDAVIWFVREIWPLVQEQLPSARFRIVGSEAPAEVRALAATPGVVLDGYVKELAPLLATVRVGVAPIRYGAGIKGKVAMTLGAGIPCVCTRIAAEGMGIRDGVHARVADDPHAFADAIVSLYTVPEEWERCARGGRELVGNRFGEDANRSSLLQVLNASEALPLSMFLDYCKGLAPRPVGGVVGEAPIDVSIIVPVFNQWSYTRACINSIIETCRGAEFCYEIVLADDGSSDESTGAAAFFPGLRIARTPKNVGFLRNCNHAARIARGRHLLLLNNDTVVLPGWLDGLISLMEADPSAAIVGSKLLYPDATIQEAGAVLWRDGTAVNCGRGQDRNAAAYRWVREVDYISGCSILIRRSFWEAVGGFDERYETAYCEDSDLAMTARSRGMRVLYQPSSEVVHFESKSYTGERTSLQRRNIARLCEKWRTVFRDEHLGAGAPEHLGLARAQRTPSPATKARRRLGKLNVLYFSPFPSHPANHGNQATIQKFGRCFQDLGHKVHFALLQTNMLTAPMLDEMRAAWDTVDVLPNNHGLVASGASIPFDGWYEEGLGERIAQLCSQYDIDVVFCTYVFQSKLLEFVPAHVLKVIDTHDKMGDRYEMLRRNGQPLEFFSCSPAEEGAYLRRADVVVARREEEARYFDSVTGTSSAMVIPHVEEPRFIERTYRSIDAIGVVASANRINLAIVHDFLAAIDRRLGGSRVPFVVHVAGQVRDMVGGLPGAQAEMFRRPWVRLHGYVPDIAEFYAQMDVIVSPVTMGTGINVKTVQAMAFGMPLLTTECGGKGIETGDPMHAHADLDALVESLLRLRDEPAELARLAAISRDRYKTFYAMSLGAMHRLFAHPKIHGAAAAAHAVSRALDSRAVDAAER